MFLHGLLKYHFIENCKSILYDTVKDLIRGIPYLIMLNMYIFSNNKQLTTGNDYCKVFLQTTALYTIGFMIFNCGKRNKKIYY